MCRSIKTLHNFEPPATEDEVRASALQFVRKLSGFTHPSKANAAAFEHAVDAVTEAAHELLAALDDEVRHVNALGPQLAGDGLRQSAQRELAEGERRRLRIALHAGRRAGE